MFFTALFILRENWKQPKSPTWSDRVSQLWYNDTMKLYAAMKNDVYKEFVK